MADMMARNMMTEIAAHYPFEGNDYSSDAIEDSLPGAYVEEEVSDLVGREWMDDATDFNFYVDGPGTSLEGFVDRIGARIPTLTYGSEPQMVRAVDVTLLNPPAGPGVYTLHLEVVVRVYEPGLSAVDPPAGGSPWEDRPRVKHGMVELKQVFTSTVEYE